MRDDPSKRYIRISYWPVERTYSTPNKLQAWKPDRWSEKSDAAREQWARVQLRRQMGRDAEYVRWEESDA